MSEKEMESLETINRGQKVTKDFFCTYIGNVALWIFNCLRISWLLYYTYNMYMCWLVLDFYVVPVLRRRVLTMQILFISFYHMYYSEYNICSKISAIKQIKKINAQSKAICIWYNQNCMTHICVDKFENSLECCSKMEMCF